MEVKQEVEKQAEDTGLKSKTKAFYYVIIALLATAGFLGWMLNKKNAQLTQAVREKVEINNINHFLTDTLEVYRNKAGQAVAKARRLEQSSTKTFLEIENLTGDNKRLQDLVRKNESRLGTNGSVTLLGSNTVVNASVKTDSVVDKDSTTLSGVGGNPDTIKTYPEYRSDFSLGKWVTGTIIANRDSIKLKPLKILDEYEIVNGSDPIPGSGFLGLWKKTTPYSEVTNLNPYSSTTVVKTYSVKGQEVKKKRWAVGAIGGYGVDPVTPGLRSFIGLGVMFKFFQF